MNGQLFEDDTIRPAGNTLNPAGFRGMAARPNSGPQGETCGSCRFAAQVYYHNKTYRKCDLIRKQWTHGAGSDIKLRFPACLEWKAIPD